MFAIPAIVALLTFIYARPHEFVEAFRALPLLYILTALAAFGLLIDLRLGVIKWVSTPQLPWVLLFSVWGLLTVLVRAPATLASNALTLSILLLIYFVVAHGVQSFRALQTVAAVVLACVLFIAFVGVHQGLSPFGCIAVEEANATELTAGKPTGIECVTREDCIQGDEDPGLEYRCERIGLVGTTSIGGGRVRYLGVLQDPNDVALAICSGIPLAIAFWIRKRSLTRLLLLLVTITIVGICTVMTQSRGGQLVFITVLGAYFVKRYGWRGVVLGLIVGSPILLLGGRGGEEAASSSVERLECWYEGMLMWRQNPVFGVGLRQFTEHHYLTAHNSYVLAAAELGLPGMILWSNVLYLSVKIPVRALQRFADKPEAEVARIWAMALLAALAGLLVGIFFLSFCYHYVLWVFLGLSGAFYSAAKRHDPEWIVRFGWRDFLGVVLIDVLLIIILYVYTHLKVV